VVHEETQSGGGECASFKGIVLHVERHRKPPTIGNFPRGKSRIYQNLWGKMAGESFDPPPLEPTCRRYSRRAAAEGVT
jgi:hypothetical protein